MVVGRTRSLILVGRELELSCTACLEPGAGLSWRPRRFRVLRLVRSDRFGDCCGNGGGGDCFRVLGEDRTPLLESRLLTCLAGCAGALEAEALPADE